MCMSLIIENIFFHLTQEMQIYQPFFLKFYLKTPARRNIKHLILFENALKAIHQPFICLLQWNGSLDKTFSLNKLLCVSRKRSKQESLEANTKLFLLPKVRNVPSTFVGMFVLPF